MRPCLLGLLAICIALSTTAFAGPLDPPAAPAPTYKTLDEVEARIPISQADIPLTIDQTGSYYLTSNITAVGTSFAIAIFADNVEIDLNGFTIDSPLGDAGLGIFAQVLSNVRRNITIRNGTIKGFSLGAIRVFGPGLTVENIHIEDCGNGIFGIGEGSVVRNCLVLNSRGENTLPVAGGAFSAIYLGDSAVVEDCIVDGLVSTSSDVPTHGIRVGSGGVVRNCTVANLTYQVDATTQTMMGITAFPGSIIEGCNVRDIGNNLSALDLVFGIWAFDSIIRNNSIHGIRNAQSFAAHGIDVVNSSRVESNHVSHIEAEVTRGIIARAGDNRTVILGNTVRGLSTPSVEPGITFYFAEGIANLNSGGVTQGNFVDITSPARLNPEGSADQVLRIGIRVAGLHSRVIGNEIVSTLADPGTTFSQRTAIYIPPEPEAMKTYVAANIASGCDLDDASLSTILGTVPAPNYFGP